MKQHLICDSLIQTLYISKLIKKENEKNAGNQGETVSSVGRGMEILLTVKVGYYPLMPLVCTSVQSYALAMAVYCLLSFIVDNFILH